MTAITYIRAVGAAAYIALTGCAPNAMPTKPADAWMMAPPKELPGAEKLKGADYKVLYTDLRSDSATEKAQLRALQKRERTLTGK